MDNFLSFNIDFFPTELALRYLVNLIATFVLVRGIYFANYKKSEVLLTFFAFNTIIFFIAYVLNNVDMSVGSAVGLFAIFSMLRYRTESLVTKDMTYLFICLSLGLLCAISRCNLLEIIILCLIIVLLTFLLEGRWLIKKEHSMTLVYDNIALIKTDQSEALLKDLKLRTGLNITRFEIQHIDFLKDATNITIYYKS